MEEPDDKTPAQSEEEETAQWIKDHEDSLDYPDVPEGNRDYKYDDSGLPQKTQKALTTSLTRRKKQLASQSKS